MKYCSLIEDIYSNRAIAGKTALEHNLDLKIYSEALVAQTFSPSYKFSTSVPKILVTMAQRFVFSSHFTDRGWGECSEVFKNIQILVCKLRSKYSNKAVNYPNGNSHLKTMLSLQYPSMKHIVNFHFLPPGIVLEI